VNLSDTSPIKLNSDSLKYEIMSLQPFKYIAIPNNYVLIHAGGFETYLVSEAFRHMNITDGYVTLMNYTVEESVNIKRVDRDGAGNNVLVFPPYAFYGHKYELCMLYYR
jgi:hypothetical protein